MSSSQQKTIEILLQFKQAGEELIKQATAEIQAMTPAAQEAAAAVQSVAPAVQKVAPATAQTFAQVKGDLVSFKKDAKDAAQAAGNSFKGMLNDIKGEFGKSSALGQSLKLLAGAGPIAALHFLTSELAAAAGKVAELADAMRKGDATTQEALGTFLRGVPVLGGFIKTFDELGEALTGAKVAAEAVNEEAQLTIKAFDAQTKSANNLRTVLRDLAEETKHSRAQTAILIAPTEVDRQTLTGAEAARVQQLADEKKIKEVKEAQAKLDGEALANRKQLIENLRTQFKLQHGEDPDAYFPGQFGGIGSNYGPEKSARTDKAIFDSQVAQLGVLSKKAADAQSQIDAAGTDLLRQHAREEAIKAKKAELDATTKVLEDRRNLEEKVADDVLGFRKKELEETLKLMEERHVRQTQAADEEIALAQKVKDAVATPQERVAKDNDQLTHLHVEGAIDDATFARATAANQAALVAAADETAVLVAQGTEKLQAQAKLSYDKDLEALRTAGLAKDQLEAAQIQREQKYQEELARIDQDAASDKLLAADRLAVALARGTDKEVADAKLRYDQDVLNFTNDQKLMQDERETFIQQAAQVRDKAIQDAADKKLLAADQLDVELTEGQDKVVAEAKLRYDQDVINYRNALNEKNLTQEQFDQAVAAAQQRQSRQVLGLPEKQADPGFFAGMARGLQQFSEQATNAANAGQQLAGDLTGGLTNAFTEIITGSKSAAKAFGEFALSIIADLAKMIIEWELAQLIMGFLKGFGGIASAPQVGGTLAGSAGEISMPAGLPVTSNKGGLIDFVRHFAGGGWVGGDFAGPDMDTVPALLTNGEFVVRKRVVQQPGILGMLQSLNSGMPQMPRIRQPATEAGGGMTPMSLHQKFVPTQVHFMAMDASAARELLTKNANVLIDVMASNRGRIKAVLG